MAKPLYPVFLCLALEALYLRTNSKFAFTGLTLIISAK